MAMKEEGRQVGSLELEDCKLSRFLSCTHKAGHSATTL